MLGVGGDSSNVFVKDLPLIIAFAVLAAYTYLAGLRAPALIAFVKDTLIYVMVIVAILYIPTKLGGWGHIFGAAQAHLMAAPTRRPASRPASFIPGRAQPAGPTPPWRSARRWPCSCTRTRSPGLSRQAARHDPAQRGHAARLHASCSGCIALLGYMARGRHQATIAGVEARPATPSSSVPQLFQHLFPSWFAGVAYAAIVIGALVPAAIMSIAAANLFTRNIYKEFFKPDASARPRRPGSRSWPR